METKLKSRHKIWFEAGLFFYLAVGLYGVIWISDDYNLVKLYLYAYVGIPLVGLYYVLRTLWPSWEERFPKSFISLVLTLLLVFLPGYVLLANTLTSPSSIIKRGIVADGKVATIAVHRGGFGLYYSTRW